MRAMMDDFFCFFWWFCDSDEIGDMYFSKKNDISDILMIGDINDNDDITDFFFFFLMKWYKW